MFLRTSFSQLCYTYQSIECKLLCLIFLKFLTGAHLQNTKTTQKFGSLKIKKTNLKCSRYVSIRSQNSRKQHKEHKQHINAKNIFLESKVTTIFTCQPKLQTSRKLALMSFGIVLIKLYITTVSKSSTHNYSHNTCGTLSRKTEAQKNTDGSENLLESQQTCYNKSTLHQSVNELSKH